MDLREEVNVDGIKVLRRRGQFYPTVRTIRIAQRCGMVGVVLDESAVVPLTTPAAIKIALSLGKQLSEILPGEIMLLCINGKDVPLLTATARRLVGGLIRKADKADDWQRGLRI